MCSSFYQALRNNMFNTVRDYFVGLDETQRLTSHIQNVALLSILQLFL